MLVLLQKGFGVKHRFLKLCKLVCDCFIDFWRGLSERPFGSLTAEALDRIHALVQHAMSSALSIERTCTIFIIIVYYFYLIIGHF